VASVVNVEHAKPSVKTVTLKLEAWEAEDVRVAMRKYAGTHNSVSKAIIEAQLGKVDVAGYQFSLPPLAVGRPF
jgi:hypothetical protein